MKKAILAILALSILFLCIFAYFNFYSFRKIDINGNVFKVELAVSDTQKSKGLSERKSMCENCAMLFIFNHPEKYSFWMKNMQFSLDIIWISDSKIVYISKNVSANFEGSIQPPVPADKVLEINSGLAEKYDLKIGDAVKF
jgi:uncharacterized protein